MQSLGLSDSTPREQSWFRSLFWPSIRNDYDVDYLTRQGFWLCMIVAGLSLLASFALRNPLAVALPVAFYAMCGIGIRVSSRTAAVCAFLAYLLSWLIGMRMVGVQSSDVIRIICLGLLLSNLRATFLAANWVATRTEPPPPPMSQTFMERFADVMPRKVWPFGQVLFYILVVVQFFALLSALVLTPEIMLRLQQH
jgi:hypothetical protein